MNKTQFYILAGLLAGILLVLAYIGFSSKPVLGGVTGLHELELNADPFQSDLNPVVMGYGSCAIEAATSSCAYQNRTGGDIFLDLTGTGMVGRTLATSTLVYFAATSTANSLQDNASPIQGTLAGNIERFAIASTTVATGTRPMVVGSASQYAGYLFSFGTAPSPGEAFVSGNNATNTLLQRATTTWMLLKNNEYLTFNVRSPSTNCVGAAGSSVVIQNSCDGATSTNRTVVDAFFRYMRFKQAGQ